MVLYQITLLVTAEQEEGVVQLFRQRNWTYNKIGPSTVVPDSLCSQLGKDYNSSFLGLLGLASAQDAGSSPHCPSFTGVTHPDHQSVCRMSENDRVPHVQTRFDAGDGDDKLNTDKVTEMKYTGEELRDVNLNFRHTLDAIMSNTSTGTMDANMNNVTSSVDNGDKLVANMNNVSSSVDNGDKLVANMNSARSNVEKIRADAATHVGSLTLSALQHHGNASSTQQQNNVSSKKNVSDDNKGVKFEENVRVDNTVRDRPPELEREVKVGADSDDSDVSVDADSPPPPNLSDYDTSTDESYTQENLKKTITCVSTKSKRVGKRSYNCRKSNMADTGTRKVKKKQWNPKDRKLVRRTDSVKYRELYGIPCTKCEHTFIFQKVYDKHLENDKCRHECEFCGKVFLYGKTSHYIMHMKYHNKEQNHKCEICGKLYIDKRNLEDHLRKHRNEKPYMCDMCGQNFIGYRYLYAHKNKHHTIQPQQLQCPKCPKMFKGKSGLQYHISHFHEKKYESHYMCDVCGKKFISKQSLINHQIVHSDMPKDFKCDECSAIFARATGLRQHKRRHAKQYSLFCSHCKKGFYHRQALTAHENMHTGTKPYECSMCNYACTVKENLKKHMKVHRKSSGNTTVANVRHPISSVTATYK